MKKVLTIDDATAIRKLVRFSLTDAGYQVSEAADGEEGLREMMRSPADLVIVDVNMPRMNGLEFTRQLRSKPQFSRVPVLLLTTESDPQKKNEGRAAGASGWITKPFQKDQLVSVVRKVLPA